MSKLDKKGRRGGLHQARTLKEWMAAIRHDKLSASGKPYDYTAIQHLKQICSWMRITYICPDHGPNTVYAFSHLLCKCNRCSLEINGLKRRGKPVLNRRLTLEEAIDKAKDQHKDLDLSKVKHYDPKSQWTVTCTKHNLTYKIGVHRLLWGGVKGCEDCEKERLRLRGKRLSLNRRDSFLDVAKGLDYTVIKFTKAHGPATLRCKKHGKFTISKAYYLTQNFSICPQCRQGSSIPENQLKQALIDSGFKVDVHRRDLLKGVELDLYLKEYKLGVEINGVFWHNDTRKSITYHIKKTILARNNKIRLLHFTDLDIKNKLPLIVSMIKAKCGRYETSIGGRQTKVIEIRTSIARKFLEKNHIQGFTSGSVYLGLVSNVNNKKLLCLGVFGKPRFSKQYDWELIRFATRQNYLVHGGLTKIFSAFEKGHSGLLVSYADLNYSWGEAYRKIGFTFSHRSAPSYSWHGHGLVVSRYKAQKHKLEKLLPEFDPSESENTNMRNNGFWKLYNCGNLIYTRQLREKDD